MAEEFKAGDVVQLKSGGPKMTVDQVGNAFSGELTVFCEWFDDSKKMSDGFKPSSLKLIPEKEWKGF